MEILDLQLIQWLNSLAGHWSILDLTMVQFSSNHLLKGGVFMTAFWWLWFRNWENPRQARRRLLALLILSFGGILLARSLAWALPFRYRPLHHPELGFILPQGMHPRSLDGWSAFPSDHAMLFMMLAVGFRLIHRQLGNGLLVYALIFVLLPRLYCGLHYPTDLLAGGLLGWGIAAAGINRLANTRWLEKAFRLSELQTGLFYAVLFIYTSEMATLFKYSRRLAGAAMKLLKLLLAG